MKQNLVLRMNGNITDLTILPSVSGTVTSDKNIGATNMSAELTITPGAGAEISGFEISGDGQINGTTYTFGLQDTTILPVWQEYVPPSITAGWTLVTNGECRPSIDFAPGTSKQPQETTTQLDGTWTSSYNANNAFGNDQFNLYCPSAGTWNITLDNWQDYSTVKYMRCDFGQGETNTLIGIDTIDFFGKEQIRDLGFFNSTTYIPSSTTALFNCSNITGLYETFKDFQSITGEIIPFITACIASMPNLSNTTRVFAGCTNAADYSQAVSQYPGWF